MDNFIHIFEVDPPPAPEPPALPHALQQRIPLNQDAAYTHAQHQFRLLAAMAEDIQIFLRLYAQPDDGQENDMPVAVIPRPLVPHRWDHLNGPAYFRFEWDQLIELCDLLDLPEKFITTNRTTMPRLEGLCLLIYHLSHPCRFKDLKLLFPRSEGALSELFNCILEYVYESWKHLLLFDHVRLTPQVLEEFTVAIHHKGGENSLDNCWAFLDGTHVRVCRPGVDQEELYSGQKKCHTIKFQAVTSPNGIIVHLGGPFSGRRHDARILTLSKLLSFLQEHSKGINGHVLVIYGDEGYA